MKYHYGFKFGAEKSLHNNLTGGLSYTQRGINASAEGVDNGVNINEKLDVNINFLTGYVIQSFPQIETNFEFIAGLEVGYFWNAKVHTEGKVTYADETLAELDTTENINGKKWKDDYHGKMLDYGFVAGVKFNINPKVALIGSYYFGIAYFTKDDELMNIDDLMNRGLQIYLNYGL